MTSPDPLDVVSGREPWAVLEGDALAVLATLPDATFDAVVTDPPYGTHAPRDGYGRRQKWGGRQAIAGDADLSALAASLPQLRRLLKPDAWLACFCSPKRRDDVGALLRGAGLRVVGEVVWDKKAPGLGGGIRYRHEAVLLCSFGKPSGRGELHSVISEWVPKGQHGHRQQLHVHEKPVPLVCDLLAYVSGPGDLVLDPFAGSGTTGVACRLLGRRFIGVEVVPAYAETARRRIAGATPLDDACHRAKAARPQPTLFDAVPESAPPPEPPLPGAREVLGVPHPGRGTS